MIGQTISHYRILEKLGEGGMGVVYKAHDTMLERDVALKFLPSHVSITAEAKGRFLQEAKAAAALNHPHICTVHGVEADGEQMFIVMEFVEGGTLRKAIPYPSVDDAVIAAIQIGEALEEAHAKGIVHRDIKADNIMLTSRGQAKVMDFGLAKLKGSLKLTRTSSTAGTLGYMAPEQIQGSDVDHRSDIFSFGVLLFEMLTGKLPFRGEHEAAMMYSILNEDPDPIGRYLPQASPELVHILNRALEKDPHERYQHVSDMVIDLRRLRKDTSKISRKTLPAMPAAGQPSSPASGRSADTPAQEPAPAGVSRNSTTVTFTIPGLAGRKKLLWLLPVALAAAGLAGYLLLSGGSEDESGERVPVAVADFINQTKEEELDGLSGMLITSLEQSRRLSVLTRSRMFDILKAMGKGDVDRIDESLGRAVSRQANVKALVVASLSKFDDLYVIDMKVLDPEKNEYILTLKEQAKGRAEIPGSIDKLSEQIRLGLKERRAEVEKNSQDVAVMTTPNLEAYQAYFRGEELVNRLEFPKAADEFRKAVAIDSGFAIAYYRLAYSLSWTGSPGAAEAIEKAMRYVDRVPEKEKYLIRAEAAVTRQDPLAAVALYRQLLDIYPEDKEANYLYGDYCFHFLDYENAERALTRVLALDQKHERAYQHLCWTLLRRKGTADLKSVARAYVANAPGPTAYSMLAESYAVRGEFDSALQICATGLERFPEDPWLRVQRGNIFLTTFSFSAAETEYSLLTGKEESYEQQTNGHLGLQVVAIAGGRYRSAMRSVETLIDLARAEKDTAGMAFWSMEKARMHVLFFRDAEAGKAAGAGAREFEGDATEPYFYAAFAYFLRSGEYQQAKEIATRRLAITGPELPHMADATEAFSSGNYGSAVEHLLKIRVVDPRVQYMLAQCYEALDQPRTTITVLEELRRNYSTHEFGSYREYAEFAARSYYVTGKAYEKLNDRGNARQNYERFLELWKHADANIPEVLDAKKRLGALS